MSVISNGRGRRHPVGGGNWSATSAHARPESDDMIRPQASNRSQLRLRDGRLLGFHVYGDRDGRPVYFFHGFPGSHEQAALVHEQALEAGVALVAFDRPGFGDSSPSARAGMAEIAADVAELADHLGHERFSLMGVSCGGPHALIAARILHERVQGVALLAGIGPMDRPEIRKGQLPLLKLMFRLARIEPWLISPLLSLDRLLFRKAPHRAVAALAGMLTSPDRQLLAQNAAVRERFATSLARAYAQGIRGALDEARRIARHRTSDLAGVDVPVHVFQSGHDRNVPPAMGAFIADCLPGARLHPCPHDGHLSIVVNRFAECIAALRLEGSGT
jgi:pimeloyl-ACP methyl ester carboxylesterase